MPARTPPDAPCPVIVAQSRSSSSSGGTRCISSTRSSSSSSSCRAMEASTGAVVVAGVLLLASTVQITTAAAILTIASATAPTTTTTASSSSSTSSPAPTPSAAVQTPTGPDFCGVSQPIRLAAAGAGWRQPYGHGGYAPASSLSLRLSPQSATPTPTAAPPCRVELRAPASNYLSIELVPAVDAAVPAAQSGGDVEDDDDDDDDDDSYDASRARTVAAMFGVDMLDPKRLSAEDADGASNNNNLGMVWASLLRQNAVRRENRLNESCTLVMYVGGEVAWSVDLCDAEAVLAAKPHMDNVQHNVSLAWTPPHRGRSLRVSAIRVSAVRRGVAADNLCSVSLRSVSLRLAGQGLESALALELRDGRPSDQRGSPCRVRVATPPSHRLSLLLLDQPVSAVASAAVAASDEADASASADGDLVADVSENGAVAEDATTPPPARPKCILSVIQGCSSELWSVDLCDPVAASSVNFTELFPSNVTLEWTPPPAPRRSAQLATTVLLTAVGKGKVCSSSHFVPCWRRPRAQPLCVSAELACDGYNNCPMDGDDEDPAQCRPNPRIIEVLGQQDRPSVVTSTYPDGRNQFLESLIDLYNSNKPSSSHSYRGHETNIHGDPSPDTLSNYGPWGYLMLGMLVCGAFLMLCGLWECCCRQPKAAPTAPSHTPTTVLMPQMGATGGVLVLDSDLEDDPSRPPAYEDLDQPPSYGVLFPPGLAGLAGLVGLVGLEPKDDAHDAAASAAVSAAVAAPAMAGMAGMGAAPSSTELLVGGEEDDDVPSLRSSSSSASMASAVS